MKKLSPERILPLVFGLIGSVFLVLGLVFLQVSRQLLPRLLDASLWLADETPPELELPMVGVVFVALGAVFAVIALIIAIARRRQQRLREELLTWGTRVTGVVADIPVDRSVQVNGRSPLRVVAEVRHPATGELVRVRSQQVWAATLSPGDAVDVLFDPMNEKRRLVDLPQAE